MKIPAYIFLLLGLFLASAGCQHLDVTPDTDSARVVTGAVNLRPDILFPPDTEVLVRVLDNSTLERAGSATAGDIPTLDRGRPIKSERVLGEQLVRAPEKKPIPFSIEFLADGNLMRRGLLIDVRISYHGRVQFRTLNAHMLTLSSLRFPQEVWVEPSR